MIEEALDLPPDENTPEVVTLDREAMLGELLAHCVAFQKDSAAWRSSSYEPSWERWQRNADAIYDPVISQKKADWQSRAFWPITPAHCENAQATLFKTEVGPKPALEYKSRLEQAQPQMPGMPPPVDQGEMIRDLVLWEREKACYEIQRNLQIEEKIKYGSGFMRARFETKTDTRPLLVPQYEPLQMPWQDGGASLMRKMSGQQQIVGYDKQTQEVITYRGIRLEWISIWDVFPDPKALDIQGNSVAVRYETTLGEILKGIEEGYYIPEAAKLKDVASDETTPRDKQTSNNDRGITEARIVRPKYGAKLRCYEMEARLPKKWVLIDGQDIDDPENLIPAVVRFHKDSIISVAPSESYDGEPMLFKDDYVPVAGQFYGRGVPEKLKDVQLVSTETINQRLDTGSIALDQKFAVNEKCLTDSKDLEENKKYVRMKSKDGIQDIQHMITRLDTGTVAQSAFVEPQEWERIGQELTSITATTLGTEDNSDTTLGAQKIQQGVTGEKMAFLGMLSEFNFQKKLSHAIWALIYQNYNPEDYAMALGMEKAAQLVILSPEQIAQNFRCIPKGIFEMENKPRRQAMVGEIQQQYGMYPWFNTLGAAKTQISVAGLDESTLILPEADAAQIMVKAQEIGQGMAKQALQQRDQEELAAKADKGAKMEGK